MRWILVALLLSSVFAASCDFLQRHHFQITFINSSDTLLCFEGAPGEFGEFRGKCLDAIKARARTQWNLECEEPDDPRTVLLTVGAGGREIYHRTAECDEWGDADATFIIKQRGDELIVTDSLPED